MTSVEVLPILESALVEAAGREMRRVPHEELKEILNAVVQGSPYQPPSPKAGGARQDWWTFATYIFAVAAFIKTVIDVYLALEKRLSRKPEMLDVEADPALALQRTAIQDSEKITLIVVESLSRRR